MNQKKPLVWLVNFLRLGIPAVFLMAAPFLPSQTFWTGPSTNFSQGGAFSMSNPGSMDQITPAVSISRNQNGPLFNPAAGETGSDSISSPSDTEWAFGSINNVGSLTFQSFASLRNGDLAGVILNQPMVLHLISDNIYISLTFTAWGQHFAGGFAYTRSTAPAAVAPTVSILTPTNGSIFAAPLSLHLTASTAGGTVNSVQYFAGTNSLGSASAAPFSVTGSVSAPGNFAIKAVATAGGLTGTSSVVNISVVTPVAVALTSARVQSNQFVFSFSATPGLNYVVQSSSNFVSWTPVVTNTAIGNPVRFTNSFIPNSNRFFRVGRLPNP